MTVFPSFFRGQNFLSVAYSLMRSQPSECRRAGIDFKTRGCRLGFGLFFLTGRGFIKMSLHHEMDMTLHSGSSRFRPCLRLVFVSMFLTLTGFIYRGLSSR
jgi:hypothetical protein